MPVYGTEECVTPCLLSDQDIQPPSLSLLSQDRDHDEGIDLTLSIHGEHSSLYTTYFMMNQRQWVSTLLMLRPFSKVSHVLVTTSHKIIFIETS